MMVAVKQFMPQNQAAILEKECQEVEAECTEDSRLLNEAGVLSGELSSLRPVAPVSSPGPVLQYFILAADGANPQIITWASQVCVRASVSAGHWVPPWPLIALCVRRASLRWAAFTSTM